MSDYRIQIGTELNTKGIDTTLKKYQGKLIEIKSKLNTSGIDKKLASYKAKKPIEVNAKLNTTGLAKKIGEYKPKTPIKLNAKLDTKNINAVISNYKAKKAIELNVKLNHSAISQQIKNYKAKNSITLNTKLNNSEITRQIKSYKAKTPINLSVKLTTKDIDEKIRTYKAKTSIKLDAKINKESINEQIKTFKPRSTIYLKAKLKKGEIAEEIRNYKPGTPVAITADFKVGRTQDVDTKITSYKNTPVDVPVRLMPAKTGFSDKITNKPVKISTTIDKNNIKKDIETAISGYTPTARMPVNIKLTMPKNINSQVTGLGKPTESINVGIELDKDKINADIALFKPTATLGIQPDLILENVDDQIRAYIPKAKIRVNAELNNSDIQALTAKNTDSAYNTVSGGSYIPNATQNLKEVDITIKATKNQITNLGKALKAVGFNNSSVKSITNDFKELGVTVTKVTSKLNSDGSVRLTVKGLDQFKDAVTYVNNIGSDGKLGTWSEMVSRDANKVTENFNRLKSIAKDIGNLKIDIFKSDDANEVKRMTDELNRLQKEYNELFAGTQGGLNGNQINQLNNIAKNAEGALSKLKKKYAETRAELARGIKGNFSGYDAEVQILVEKFGMLSAEMPNVEAAISRVKRAFTDMRAAAKAGDDNALIEAEQRYQDELKETAALLKQNQSIERQGDYKETFATKKEAAQIKLNGLLEKGSHAAKKYGAEVRILNEELNKVGSLSAQKLIDQKIANLDKKIKAEGLQRKTWGTRLKEQLSKYTQYLSIASVFIYGTQALRSMFEQVKAIDTAMIELKKVTDETSASYNIFLKNAASRAKEIGTTIDGLVTSTADFARLGYGFKDAQGLAEVANIYAVVGDEIENVEDASQSLISTMAAFKDEMNGLSNSDFALSIVDKFNEVSNNFSISSGGIGEALTRSASSLAAANNTLDESIALITAANTVVQDPAIVGTAFKTISMRIRGAKTELEDAGLETEGMVESTSKLREEILALSGVDIMASATEFKSTYQILDELAEKWKDLTDIQQASVTELIAGKRQGNIVSSIMENFDTARKVLDTSMNSAGSAMTEHEKWMKSVEASINKVKASWQSLSQSFLKSDFLKGLLGTVAKLADAFTGLMDTFGTLPTLATLFMGGMSLFNKGGFFKVARDELTGFATGITSTFGQVAKSVNHSLSTINLKGGFRANLIQSDIDALRNYDNALAHKVSQTTAWSNCMANASAAAQDAARSNEFLTGGLNGYIKSQQAAEVSTMAQNKSLGSASALMKEYQSGCKTTGMAQADFANAVKKTNPQLATAMTSTNSVKAGMFQYTASLIGAKVASLGLQVATMALNMALTMGIGLLVSGLFSAISKVINAKKELAEKVEEVTSKFKEQTEELNKNKSSFNALAKRFAELSKGVDANNKNVSLTTDEYSEYLNIVNDIANQAPSLVKGYDSQGNAILKVTDGVNGLTVAYEKLIEAQNNELLNPGKDGAGIKDIEKDFKNKIGEFDVDTNRMEFLESALNGNYSKEEIIKKSINDYKGSLWDIIEILHAEGLAKDAYWYSSQSTWADAIAKAIEDDPDKVREIINNFKSDVEGASDEIRTAAQAALSNAIDFSFSDHYDMGDELKTIAQQVVGGLSSKDWKEVLDSGVSVEDYVNSIVDSLSKLEETGDSKTFETAFNLETQFNNGEVNYGEYVKGIQEAGQLIDELVSDGKIESRIGNQIKLSLNIDEITENYDALKNRLTSEEFGINMETDEAKKFLDGLTKSEYAVAVDLIMSGEIDLSEFDIDSLRDYIKEQAKLLDAMNFTISIDVETENFDKLNTALAESVSATGLSSESIEALKARYADLASEGYNLSAMFEETSNGIHLNKAAVSELEQAYTSDKLAETNDKLATLKNRYDELTTEIDNCTRASDRAALYKEQRTIIQKINDLATLASQYEGLASAYNAWQNAESAGSERDMYEGILEGFENISDELSRGWTDDGTIKFLELLSGKTDLAGKSGKELKEIYDDLDESIKNTGYSVRDFFTVDDEGNSTSKGVYNFLDAVNKLGEETFGGKDVVKKDKNGNIIGFDFELVAEKDENGNVIKNGDQVIAEALGISEELVQIMVRASDDAGFVINMEGAYTQLADLKNEAEAAKNSLIELQKTGSAEIQNKLKGIDLNFNLDAKSKDLVTEQEKAVKLLDKFKKDGKVDLKMEGAQEALDIAEYLTIKLDDLTEPRFMQIDTSKIEDEDIQGALEQIQEIGDLCKDKHLISLEGDKEELKETQDEIDKIANALAVLENDTKEKVGIDVNWDAKTIADKIEKGEIEIPAELELDVQMSQDLKDMRLMMMNQLGLVKDEEVKLKVGYDIDESIVDNLTEDEKEVVIKYIEENEDVWDDYTDGEKEAVVKIIADGTDIENWEAEDKEALVKYVVDGGDVEDWTPEQKHAWAQYLVEHGDIDGWSPEMKQAWVQYLVDGGDIEGWTPEMKEAYAKYIVDGGDVTGYTPEDKKALAKYIVDGGDPANYQPPSKTQNVKAKLDSSEPDDYQPKDKKFTVKAILQKVGDWWDTLLSGGSKRSVVNGTANVDGTAFINGTTGRAFKRGDWSIKDSGTALVGELGAETLVRDGRYYTIGDTGAEFIRYKKGDIIFNHKQTEELFKNGKVDSGGGRGEALVSGTAFSKGTGGGEEATTITVGVNKNTGASYTKSADSEDDFEETIDWIETAIDRIERAIDHLDTKANSTYRSWSERNSNLTKQISKVGDEIALQQSAYEEYMAAAAGTGLSSSYAEKVRNGKIDIETIKDETLKEKIEDYQKYYEKALDCKDAIEELKETEASLYAQRVENASKEYDGILGVIEHEKNMLDEYISQSEAQGWLVSANYYNALASNEQKTIAQLEKKKASMLDELQAAMESGTIAVKSESWYEMVNSIDEVTLAIAESETQLKEYAQTIQQSSWETFDLLQDKISSVTSETEFLIDLMSNAKLYDDKGQLTDEGKATMGLHGVAYNTYMYQADKTAKEAEKLKKQLSKDPYDTDLEERYREMISLQQEYILNAQNEKEAIKDLVSDGIEAELDALQELIDKKNEQLQSEKDLYDYQKKVKSQVEEISSLEKQLAAYTNDNSSEAMAKKQQISADLETAREDLQETEFDKLVDDTSDILDELYSEYEELLNTRLDNLDALVSDMITEINTDASSISSTISEKVDSVGYTLTDSMKTIWSESSKGTQNVVTTYGEKFTSAQTTTNNALNTINTNLQNMIAQLNKLAKTDVKSASTSSASNPKEEKEEKTANKFTSTTASKELTTDTKKTITVGGLINAGSAKIYDYAGDTSGERQYYRSDPIYKVLKEKNGYLLTRWHKLSTGYTGWFKKGDVKAYATGKKNFSDDEIAWTQENGGKEFVVRPSDGAILTPVAKGDSILTSAASNNIWDMANSPAEFIKDNLNLGVTNVPNNSNVNNTYTQNFENVVFSMPNVKNYEQLISEMQRDPKFEKLVLAMTVNQIAGKSKLAKNKAIR